MVERKVSVGTLLEKEWKKKKKKKDLNRYYRKYWRLLFAPVEIFRPLVGSDSEINN